MRQIVLCFIPVLLAMTCTSAQDIYSVPSRLSKFSVPAEKLPSSMPKKGSASSQQDIDPLGKYLNPDGTLNTPPGFQGNLDPKGWQLTTGRNGKPRFVRSSLSVMSDPADSAWDDEFKIAGINDDVFAIAVSGSTVYVGGWFTSIGGIEVNYIAKWDGTSWSALGTGMDPFSSVSSLVVIGTDLYAGGIFSTAGGVSANCIAKWDGTSWSALGTGMSPFSQVSSLVVIGTDLYAGGSFTTAGGVSANNIAKWDGTIWSALGTGLDGSVYCLAVSGTDLYAGGSFTTAGGVSANNIAK